VFIGWLFGRYDIAYDYLFQTIVPVLVTFFSMVLKLEKHSKARYIAIGIDFLLMIIVIIVRAFYCKV
jgi:drug/metabolite transporter (DMT)-like permease